MKQRLCDYSNCTIECSTVTVNYHDQERPAFCGACHAALWLLNREGHRSLAKELESKLK